MKKSMLATVAAACVGSLLMIGSASAIPLTAEYELISPEPMVGPSTYTPGTDLGYYIWTDDVERKDWHIRWSGEGPDTLFSGYVILEGNQFDEFYEFSFDNHPNSSADWSYNTSDAAQYFAIANVGHDGLDFTILNTDTPSFVGFDLFMDFSQDIGDNIYFGSANITAASLGSDGDFKIAAPVPEPTTMLLFGAGLLGLVGYNRRRSNK